MTRPSTIAAPGQTPEQHAKQMQDANRSEQARVKQTRTDERKRIAAADAKRRMK